MTTTTLMQLPTSASLPSPKKDCAPVLPPKATMMLVGEAPGQAEEGRTPFLGAAGKELDWMLAEAEIPRYRLAMTNVFMERPPENNLGAWALPRKEILQIFSGNVPGEWTWIAAGPKGSYVNPSKVLPALNRLRGEIEKVKPNVIVALGNTALAALTGQTGIGKVRGTILSSTLVPGCKVLPTYHPAAILRNYEFHTITVADLMKAKREAETPAFNFRRRTLYLEPTLTDLAQWQTTLLTADLLAVDVETRAKQITCIGFAPSATEAYVVPFWTRFDGDYWKEAGEEIVAWKMVKAVLEGPSRKIFQNGLYDIQYCLHHKWYPQNVGEDTMLKFHALYPALPKGLDFLGSLYCNERAWKRFRPRGGEEKREA